MHDKTPATSFLPERRFLGLKIILSFLLLIAPLPHPSSSKKLLKWQPTPVLLSGKSQGWRSLMGYSPWGCEEQDTTQRLPFLSVLYRLPECPSVYQMGCYPSSLIMPIRSSNLVGWILVFNRQIAFLHISKTNVIQNILLLIMTVGVFLHTLVIMLLTCPLKLSQLGIGEKMSWLHLFLNEDDHQFFTCTNVYFPLL